MIKLILVVSCLVISVVLSKELPSGINKCKRDDPELSKCVREAIQVSLSLFAKGIPEFGIDSFDPMTLDAFEAKGDPKAVFSVNQKYRNLKAYGTSGVKILNAKATINNEKCEFKVKSIQPIVEIYGDYEVAGKALLFNINGHGKANISGTDLRAKSLIHCEIYKKDNEEYLRFKDVKLEIIDMKTFHLDLENIFDGNKELSKSINAVLNENAKDLLKDLTGGFDKGFGDQYLKIVNKFVDGIPLNKLFLE